MFQNAGANACAGHDTFALDKSHRLKGLGMARYYYNKLLLCWQLYSDTFLMLG